MLYTSNNFLPAICIWNCVEIQEHTSVAFDFQFGWHLTYRNGPFKRWVSNTGKRRSQMRAGGRSRSQLISAGSQISAGLVRYTCS